MSATVKPIRPASVSAETRHQYESVFDAIAILNEHRDRNGHHAECWEKLFAGLHSFMCDHPDMFFGYFGGGEEYGLYDFMHLVRREVGLGEKSDAVGEKVG